MAQINVVDWNPSPLPALPKLSLVRFKLNADGLAKGFQVRYELQSVHLQFRMPHGGIFLPKEEEDVSEPVPTPGPTPPPARQPTVILDRFLVAAPTQDLEINVKRGLFLDRAAGGSPGLVHMQLLVHEIDANGKLRFPSADIATITLAFGV